MQGEKDNDLINIHLDNYEIAILTDIGDREEQQDNYGVDVAGNSLFITVCDGMGGYRGGRRASHLAVQNALMGFEQQSSGVDPITFLRNIIRNADRAVSSMRNEDGTSFNGGTTMIITLLYNNYLYWSSVGDSRIYLIRNDKEYIQLTQDQNYRTVIDEQLRTGVITGEEYDLRKGKADALINYVGIGDIELFDYNTAPLPVRQNDKILLTTDGLYRLLSDQEIAETIFNYEDAMEALSTLAFKIKRKAKIRRYRRDNLTMILIKSIQGRKLI